MTKFNKKNGYKNYLICKEVVRYWITDKEMFFEWINRIDCIESFSGAYNELYLDLVDRSLTETDITHLMVFFMRYKMDVGQIIPYKNLDNEKVFHIYRKKKILSSSCSTNTKKFLSSKKTKVLCKSIKFYDQTDKDICIKWIESIPAITLCNESSDEIYLYFKSENISYEDLLSITALMYRYKIMNMQQLQIFVNEENKAMYTHPAAFWHRRVFGTKKNPKIL